MTRSRRRRFAKTAALTSLAAAAFVVGSASGASAHSGDHAPDLPAAGRSSVSGSDLATVRSATAKYHRLSTALADGYIPVSGCEQLPGVGAMGVHYLNPVLASDGVIDPLRPELLLYVPTGGGRLQLAGVEYFAAEQAVPARPSALGLPFNGPMDGHSAQMPRHYDLHLWLWKHNPAGVAATWNPALSCG